jgi:hypothetical protein
MRSSPRIFKNIALNQRKPNIRVKARHHEFIRQLPCLRCGMEGRSECAHVRSGADGGIGLKPSSRFTVPLCVACHARQHSQGELTFWSEIGIDPLDAASALWTKSGDLEAGERIIFRARQAINLRNQHQEEHR